MHCDRSNESITPSVERFDVTRGLSRVAERRPKFVHRPVQPSIEINEGVIRPKGVPQIVPGHNLTMTLKQEEKKLERLVLEFNAESVLAKFAGRTIYFECSKPERRSRVSSWHGCPLGRVC